ncbi:hypothetical protein GCM10027174_12810 [Salinifilum aidingensis]
MRDSRAPRPNPALWVWYAFGGRLPERFHEWVLHDVTCRTWVLRHLGRGLVQLSPGLLFLLVPGPLWIKGMALLGGVILALWFSAAYMEHTIEHRVHKHGYGIGTARAVRDRLAAEREAARKGAGPRNSGAPASEPTAGGEDARASGGTAGHAGEESGPAAEGEAATAGGSTAGPAGGRADGNAPGGARSAETAAHEHAAEDGMSRDAAGG